MTEKQHITQYLGNMVRDTYGVDAYIAILTGLRSLENGTCGCELAFYVFPALLRLKEITPDRQYIIEEGFPKLDGANAATIEQRSRIQAALLGLGHNILSLEELYAVDLN